MIPAKQRQEPISQRHCTNSKGGDATRTHIVQYPKNSKSPEDGPYTPHKDLHDDQERRNDDDESKTNHTQWARQPHDRNIRKHNKHILAARVWDTFSIQPGPSHGPHRPSYGRKRPVHATDHKPRKLHTYPNLYYIIYSITSKGGNTIQQNRKNESSSV